MGEHFAFSAADIEVLVNDLLVERKLIKTKNLVGCREMQMINIGDGVI